MAPRIKNVAGCINIELFIIIVIILFKPVFIKTLADHAHYKAAKTSEHCPETYYTVSPEMRLMPVGKHIKDNGEN